MSSGCQNSRTIHLGFHLTFLTYECLSDSFGKSPTETIEGKIQLLGNCSGEYNRRPGGGCELQRWRQEVIIYKGKRDLRRSNNNRQGSQEESQKQEQRSHNAEREGRGLAQTAFSEVTLRLAAMNFAEVNVSAASRGEASSFCEHLLSYGVRKESKTRSSSSVAKMSALMLSPKVQRMQRVIRINEGQLLGLAEKARYDSRLAGFLHKRCSDSNKWLLRWFRLYQVSERGFLTFGK